MSNNTTWTPAQYEAHQAKMAGMGVHLGGVKSEAAPVKAKVGGGGGNVACEAAEADEARWLAKAKGAGREVWPKMNKLERSWGEFLALNYPTAKHLPQAITLRWAFESGYRPDWVSVFTLAPAVVIGGDALPFRLTTSSIGLVVWETKGHDYPVGQLKLKTCSHLFNFATFIKVKRIKGAWQFTRINP